MGSTDDDVEELRMNHAEYTCLHHLPLDILTLIGTMLVDLTNPSSLIKLALTSRAMFSSISSLDSLFIHQSKKQGWPVDILHRHDGSQSSMAILSSFKRYTRRMNARRTVRGLMKRLLLHLRRIDSLSFRPGASIDDLNHAEARLLKSAVRLVGDITGQMDSLHLPVDLWELLRFRDGQDYSGRLIDDTRLLSSREIYLELQPPSPLQKLQKLQQELAVGMDPGRGEDRGLRLMVVMAENESRTRRYLVDLISNQVFIARGVSIVGTLSSSVIGLLGRVLT